MTVPQEGPKYGRHQFKGKILFGLALMFENSIHCYTTQLLFLPAEITKWYSIRNIVEITI